MFSGKIPLYIEYRSVTGEENYYEPQELGTPHL